MFSTDNGARFEGPAHGTLIETAPNEWDVACHAHETARHTRGRQFLMDRIAWTADSWWRPVAGKVPTSSAPPRQAHCCPRENHLKFKSHPKVWHEKEGSERDGNDGTGTAPFLRGQGSGRLLEPEGRVATEYS